MKQIFSIFFLALAFATFVSAQPENKVTSYSTTIERKLIEMERQLSDALIRQDAVMLDSLWSDDLVFTFPDGKVSNKVQRLSGLKPPAQPTQATPESNVSDEVKVNVYKDTAVATVLSTWKSRINDQEFSQQYQATHVWVKQKGRWRLVAAHVSQVKK
jgi:ketosteroid isomerase-like protein